MRLLSAKQREQIEQLDHLRITYGINCLVNEPLPAVDEPVSLDIEHDEAGGFVGIGVYVGSLNTHYWYTDILSLDLHALSSLRLIGHNAISDIETLRFWGFDVKDECISHDTMLIGHISDSSLKTYGLKDMAKRELGIEYPSYDEIVGKRTAKQATERVTLDKQPPVLVQLYNMADCWVTWKLAEKQRKQCV